MWRSCVRSFSFSQKGEELGGSGSAVCRRPSRGESTEQEEQEEEEVESKSEETLSIERAEGAGQFGLFGGGEEDDGAASTSGLEFAAPPERLVDEQVSQSWR